MTTRVQCRCGEVEIELTGEPLVQFYCHCDDCQAVHGAAYAPESVYPSDAVTVVRGGPKALDLEEEPAILLRPMRDALIYRCPSSRGARLERLSSSGRPVSPRVPYAVPVRGTSSLR